VLAHVAILALGVATFFFLAALFAPAFLPAFLNTPIMALVLAAAGALGVIVLGSRVLAAQLARPLRRLVAAARRISNGHYDTHVSVSATVPIRELNYLTSAFNDMAASLEAAEQRRIELLGEMAHELRTPVAILEGYLEGLLDGMVQPTPETWAMLHDEASRLHRLVDELQHLTRVQAHQLPPDLVLVDPAEIAGTALDRLRLHFAEKGLTVVTAFAPHLPPVRADRDHTLQILSNLLTNALRYTPAPGQVTITVSRPTPREVLFQVADTGIGMGAEHLPQLFERFYRVDPTRSRSVGGAGIGLPVARALVEGMGGHIWVESPGPGRGTTVSFTLPVVQKG
jgi:signal transduction histidine kinase